MLLHNVRPVQPERLYGSLDRREYWDGAANGFRNINGMNTALMPAEALLLAAALQPLLSGVRSMC